MTNQKVGRDKDFRQSCHVALDDDTADKWQTEPNVLPGSSTQPLQSSIPAFSSFFLESQPYGRWRFISINSRKYFHLIQRFFFHFPVHSIRKLFVIVSAVIARPFRCAKSFSKPPWITAKQRIIFHWIQLTLPHQIKMETTTKEIQQKSPGNTFNFFIFAVFLVHRDDSSTERRRIKNKTFPKNLFGN
jgi:hypothetical protein